jgi:hypothetical protein
MDMSYRQFELNLSSKPDRFFFLPPWANNMIILCKVPRAAFQRKCVHDFVAFYEKVQKKKKNETELRKRTLGTWHCLHTKKKKKEFYACVQTFNFSAIFLYFWGWLFWNYLHRTEICTCKLFFFLFFSRMAFYFFCDGCFRIVWTKSRFTVAKFFFSALFFGGFSLHQMQTLSLNCTIIFI